MRGNGIGQSEADFGEERGNESVKRPALPAQKASDRLEGSGDIHIRSWTVLTLIVTSNTDVNIPTVPEKSPQNDKNTNH